MEETRKKRIKTLVELTFVRVDKLTEGKMFSTPNKTLEIEELEYLYNELLQEIEKL